LAINEQITQEAHIQTADKLFTEIEGLLFDCRNSLGESKLELPSQPEHGDQWSLVLSRLENIFETAITIRYVHTDVLEKMFDDNLAHQISNVVEKTDLAFQETVKMIDSEKASGNMSNLTAALNSLTEEMTRFRATRTTRKFNLEDVENFYVFFHSLRSIGEELIKLEDHLKNNVNN
jgi:hypothetical protein